MNKKLLLIAVSLLLTVITNVQAAEKVPEKQHNHESGALVKLKLDKGKKWQADLVANKGNSNMVSLVKKSIGKNNTIKDYNLLGNSLQKEVNNILNNCTMKGEGHEELHKHLLQVIDEVKILKGKDTGKAKQSLEKLDKILIEYPKYFK